MKTTCFALLCFLSFSLFGQVDVLPIGLTPTEKIDLENYFPLNTEGLRNHTTPPVGNLRTMAEWEETDYLLVTWVPNYSNTLTSIVEAATKECKVIIITPNPNNVQNVLLNSNAEMDSITFLNRSYNSIWIRDYGAHSVYKDWNDSLILVDWIYNRPRPLDDNAPVAYADLLDIPLYQTTQIPYEIVGTGGNFMVDGFGTAFSSNLILDENGPGNNFGVQPKTAAQVDQVFEDFMGVDRYIKMTNLPYDDIHHIDMHMKLLDEETLLVSEYPNGVADGPQIEANLQYVLSNFNSVYGTPYKVVRIPSPPSVSGLYPNNNGYYRTYANNVIVNNTVIVPYYREEFDTIAERILKEAMPGYKIVGVNVDASSGEQLIAAGGAIHCITHAVGVADPLLISHQALPDTYDNINPYLVEAYVSHRSGIQEAKIHYKIGSNGSFQTLPMFNFTGDNWQALIPAEIGEVDIYYYIEATANNGKQLSRPMPAPDGTWKFKVFVDPTLNTQNIEINDDIKPVYPNPTDGFTVVPFEAKSNELGEINLFDASGRKIEEIHQGSFNSPNNNYFFNAANLNKGVYIVEIKTNLRTFNQRLIVK